MAENTSLHCPDTYSLSGIDNQGAPAKFSFFRCPVKNTVPQRAITLCEAYQLIRSDSYKRETDALRTIADKKEVRNFKAEYFNYVCFSGTFSKRSAHALIQHSGLMVLDFDHIDDVYGLKRRLLDDRFFVTQLLFVSPSGDGVKWIISIDLNKNSHLNWFNAIANYIRLTYGLTIDPTGKDVCRATFLPHDADVYLHPYCLTSLISTNYKINNHENN